MTHTVADFMIERLREWGVRRIYGYPGDGINGLTSALRKAGDAAGGGMDFVQARHEEMAAFMASAHAKYTGELGVCLTTSGPGAIHALNGLYDAKMDHQPVLALVGQQPRTALGGSYYQEVDLVSLFKDVAGDYVQLAVDSAQMRHLVDRACRIALAERTVTALIIPNDLQETDATPKPPRKHARLRSSTDYTTPDILPARHDLERAADVLNSGEKVAMLVGQGALHATGEVTEVADILGAGVAKALLGKAAVSDHEPWVTGAIGLLGTGPSWDLMQGADTLLMVGTNMPYSDFLPREGQARGVQIDINGKWLGFRYPTEVNLVGDSRETLRALIPMLERKTDRFWRERVERGMARWWKVVEARAMNRGNPLNPQRVFWELSPKLPDDVIVSCDCGTATGWYARDLKLKPSMKGSLSGTLLSMGGGMPYAIAGKFTHPNRPAVVLAGDGAMQMNGLAELLTVKKYWKGWSDPRFIVLVLNNRDLNFVTWEQRATQGDAKYEPSQGLPDFEYARFAEALGFKGIRVDDPDDVEAAWEEAWASERPVVYEAVVDPDVPPLPPHIGFDQAVAFTRAIYRGDPDSRGIIARSFADAVENFIPHR
ncbi:MAG TPA: thiamine pyrophosphate-requiring protein [Rubrobacter sp.]|nr:thiamine pyrophosphate-requiring protein [Rubrobacter sp.]